MRQELEAMVHQIEAETADAGENGGQGRVPAGFCTLTTAVYKWDQLHELLLLTYPPAARESYTGWKGLSPGSAKEKAKKEAFYALCLENPGAVAWYCALKMEMAVYLTQELLTKQLQSETVPGLAEVKVGIQEELKTRLGVAIEVEDLPDLRHFGHVDDFYASFEWSDGGMFHAHMAFWVVGAPRIDKVTMLSEATRDGEEVEVPLDDVTVLPQVEAAGRMASFWDRALTEFNVAKALSSHALPGDIGPRTKAGKKAEKELASPEMLSHRALAHCLLGGLNNLDEVAAGECWEELENIFLDTARASEAWSDFQKARRNEEDLVPPGSASERQGEAATPGSAIREEKAAFARKLFVSALAEWVNMHDLHKPFAQGPPAKGQQCAAVENAESELERVSCNKLYPRKCIEPGTEEIAEDPRRRDLYRLWLARNCNYLNNFVPIVLLALLGNMDFQATLTKEAVIEYMTKYMTKSGKASLIKVMEHSFSLCIEKAREQQQGSGAAVLRWFNLQSITEAKSQLETMHLLAGAPRYICSREFRDIYLRSESRPLKTKKQIEQEENSAAGIAGKTGAEVYTSRDAWKLPTAGALQQRHPLTRRPCGGISYTC